jgi:RNA polymerase sporulation-specific sigma factor
MANKKNTVKKKKNSPTDDMILYIGGSETLPPPLSREEERECLLALTTEHEESARKKLIAHNLRLVVYLARKFENTGVCVEDLISIGTIGLIKGIHTFNPEKNIKLATYASRCIENEILMYLRRTSKLKLEVSFDEPLNVDYDGNELLLSDIISTEENYIVDEIENDEQKSEVLEAVNELRDRERQILILRFGLENGEEMTQKEVADVLGISQSYISRLEKRIIAELRKKIDG